MIISCPFCGARPESEFTYGGDATLTRPSDYSESASALWLDYVYYRDNPRGLHQEFWHHSSGCYAWLVVERDTLTHIIQQVRVANRDAIGAVS